MKKINFIYLFVFYIMSTSCKSQSIVNLDMENFDRISGKYYKDIDNKLNPYVGTWLYTSGTTSLKISILKVEHDYNESSNYYADLLVGEFQFIKDGVEIINRLPLLNPTDVNIYNNSSISGIRLLKSYYPPLCSECSPFVKRVNIHFNDPLRPYLNFSSYIGINGSLEDEKLIFYLKREISIIPSDDSPTDATIPEGKYILNKL